MMVWDRRPLDAIEINALSFSLQRISLPRLCLLGLVKWQNQSRLESIWYEAKVLPQNTLKFLIHYCIEDDLPAPST